MRRTEGDGQSPRGRLWRLLESVRTEPALNRLITRSVRASSAVLPGVRGFGRRHLPPLGLVTQPLPNGRRIRLWTEDDDYSIARDVFWRGWAGYEPETSRLYFALARDARHVVDVGANVGYFTLLAALARREAKVWAFEPLPANVDRLRKNLGLNTARGVQVLEVALSDRAGTADFYVPRAERLSVRSALANPAADASHPPSLWDRAQVPVETFDALAAKHGIDGVDLVKIDVEGGEPQVLQGMRNTLVRDHPALVVEILDVTAAEQVWRVVDPLGYRFYRLTGHKPEPEVGVPRRIFDWRNYLLVAPESRLWGTFQAAVSGFGNEAGRLPSRGSRPA